MAEKLITVQTRDCFLTVIAHGKTLISEPLTERTARTRLHHYTCLGYDCELKTPTETLSVKGLRCG